MISEVTLFLQTVYGTIPETYRTIFNVLGSAIIITLYALLTWKFYTIIAHKDLLKLDLSKYNQSKHPFLSRFLGTVLYILEYIIVLPFFIFVWFAVLSLVIFLITKETSFVVTLQFTAAIVASIRILAYYKKDIAEDIAKLLPLAVIVAVVTEGELNLLSRIISIGTELPSLTEAIVPYLILIAALELLMRMLDLLFGLDD